MEPTSFLPWMPTADRLRTAVERLVAAAQPEQIILFGSYTRGDTDDHSDIDLLVVERIVDDRYEEMIRPNRALKELVMPCPPIGSATRRRPERPFVLFSVGALPSGAALASFFTEGPVVKITTCNDRPVRHVRYMPDSSVILKLYEQRPDGRARHLRVSLGQWLVGRGV